MDHKGTFREAPFRDAHVSPLDPIYYSDPNSGPNLLFGAQVGSQFTEDACGGSSPHPQTICREG